MRQASSRVRFFAAFTSSLAFRYSAIFIAPLKKFTRRIWRLPHNAPDGTSSVSFFNFATGLISEIVKISKPLDLGLGVSPDGKTLLYSQADQSPSNLMLIENFH